MRTDSEVVRAAGGGQLQQLTLRNAATRRTEEIAAAALFILIGARPDTDWLPTALARDAAGYLLTGTDLKPDLQPRADQSPTRRPLPMETSIPGVFAAGDIRPGATKRAAAAVGEGAAAVQLAHQYLAIVPGDPPR